MGQNSRLRFGICQDIAKIAVMKLKNDQEGLHVEQLSKGSKGTYNRQLFHGRDRPPSGICLWVGNYLTTTDVAACARVSKKWHTVFSPLLYVALDLREPRLDSQRI